MFRLLTWFVAVVQNPLLCVCFYSLIFRHNGRFDWLILGTAFLVAAWFISKTGQKMAAITNGEDALWDFLCSKELMLTEIPQEDDEYWVNENGKTLRGYLVQSFGRKRLTHAKAYVNPLGVSFIFLPREYSESNPLDVFVLEHELEHVRMHGKFFAVFAAGRSLTMPLAAFALLALGTTWPQLVLFALYCVHVFISIGTMKTYGEVIADSFALVRMKPQQAYEAVQTLLELFQSQMRDKMGDWDIADGRFYYMQYQKKLMDEGGSPIGLFWNHQTVVFDVIFTILYIVFATAAESPPSWLRDWTIGVAVIFFTIDRILSRQAKRVNEVTQRVLSGTVDPGDHELIFRDEADFRNPKDRVGFVSGVVVVALIAFGLVRWLGPAPMQTAVYLVAPIVLLQIRSLFTNRLKA